MGKTTMLRDIARQLSDGGMCVGIADERHELAACHMGVPTLDVGLRTDVMDGCPRDRAIAQMLRAMAPQVVVADEIGSAEDALALADAARCGAGIVASAHAAGLEEALSRPNLRTVLDGGRRGYRRAAGAPSGLAVRAFGTGGRGGGGGLETRIALAVCVVLGSTLCGKAASDAVRRRYRVLAALAEDLQALRIHMTGMLMPLQCALDRAGCALMKRVAEGMREGRSASEAWQVVRPSVTRRGGPADALAADDLEAPWTRCSASWARAGGRSRRRCWTLRWRR